MRTGPPPRRAGQTNTGREQPTTKRISTSGLALCWAVVIASSLLFRQGPLLAQPAGGEVTKTTFDDKDALAGWTITGDVALDPAKDRGGKGGALKVGPGGKAVLKLRDRDASGKVELWVYDDGTTHKDVKAHRVGPRWGLIQGDGRVLAAGILYANYLGGDEGYSASACDGKAWYDQLFWLGVRRKPAGWHKWTLNFRTEGGIQVLHNNRDVNATKPPHFNPAKAGLKGFRAIAIWGDNKKGTCQTIWVDDVSVTLGGPVKSVPQPRPTAPRVLRPRVVAARLCLAGEGGLRQGDVDEAPADAGSTGRPGCPRARPAPPPTSREATPPPPSLHTSPNAMLS